MNIMDNPGNLTNYFAREIHVGNLNPAEGNIFQQI